MNLRGSGAPRPRQTRRSGTRWLLALTSTAMVAAGLATTTAPAQALPAPTAVQVTTTATTLSAADLYERRVRVLINRKRAARGLPRLRPAACPDGTALRWSRHLAATDTFYHQSMTTVLDTCNAQYAGETLGRGSMSPSRLVYLWMHSSGHRAVLLSTKSRRFGVGAVPYGTGWVVAANFVRF